MMNKSKLIVAVIVATFSFNATAGTCTSSPRKSGVSTSKYSAKKSKATACNFDKILAAGWLNEDKTDISPYGQNTRLVEFTYDENVSFFIKAMDGVNTNIEVPEGELIQGFYLSDANTWDMHVTGDKRRVLLKPKGIGLKNTATMVTDQRSYELTLESVGKGSGWFQRVRWNVRTAGADNGIYWEPTTAGSIASTASASGVSSDEVPFAVDPRQLKFDYIVSGNADFTPKQVFTDGVRTFFRLGAVQDIPAIFIVDHDGELDVVDFIVKDGYVIVPRISNKFVMKLGDKEVMITKKNCTGFFCKG